MFFFVDKGDGNASSVSASCRTSDAVYIVFGIMRHIVIDYYLDVINVNASGHNIRSYKHLHITCFEVTHHLLSRGLVEVRVHFCNIYPSAF